MNVEQLAKQLESVQGHIRALDGKAQVVLGIDGVLSGLVAAQLSTGLDFAAWHLHSLSILFIAVSCAAITALLISVCCAIATVFPKLSLGQPKSHFFFLHLWELYGNDFQKAAKGLISLSDSEQLHQLATQVHANSIIATVKAGRSNKAIFFMAAALLLFIVNLAPLGMIAYQAKSQGGSPSVQVPCTAK